MVEKLVQYVGCPGPRRVLWWGVTAVAIALIATGCRATPPVEDDPTPVEEPEPGEAPQPEEEFEEDDEAPQKDDDADEREDTAEDDGVERVASHVESRIISAIEDADQGDVDGAIEALVDLIDEPEGGFMAAYNAGVLHDRRGDLREAAQYYAAALQRQPDFTPALQNLIRLYLRVGEVAEADEVGRTFVERRPDNLDHRAAYLDVALARGRYEDAIAGAREVLRRDVEHVDAMIQLARAKYHLGRYELAAAIVRGRAMALSPERSELYFILGQIAWAMDQPEDAQEYFAKAVDLQPRFPEARNNYAILLLNAGNFARAIDHLERALEDAPLYVEAWVNLGNAYKADGQYGEAEKAYQEALAIDDESGEAHYNLGLLYLEAEVPGHELIDRNQLAIQSLNRYRQLVGERQASEDMVGEYVNEAMSNIEAEEQRLEARRQLQAAQGGNDDDDDDEDDEDDEEDLD